MPQNQVCLFFYVKGQFLIHSCSTDAAENYGDFLVYPHSHLAIWDKYYAKRYHPADFDFFPRGRVAFRKSDQTFLVFHDRCLDGTIKNFVATHYTAPVELKHDIHYQCHRCNPNYV